MNVVIFDGGQRPPTFVVNLLNELAGIADIRISLAGKSEKLFPYYKDKIHRIPTGCNNKIILLCQSIVLFLTLNPAVSFKLFSIIKKQSNIIKVIETYVLCAAVLKNKPDILHIQWTTHIVLFEELIKLGKFKTIISFRGFMVNVTPWINNETNNELKRLLPIADGYHAVSKSILAKAEMLGATKSIGKVIYPAVSSTLLRQNVVNRVDNKIRILSIGRDHWIKGYPFAINAMSILKQKSISFHYTIVAGGKKEELSYHINDLNLSEDITLIDSLPHNEVLKLYTENNFFLLPSIEEGVANVVLEAMALGVPVISTNCGGMSEVIINGVNGFIVPVRNSVAIANTIQKVSLLNQNDISNLIYNAKETIRKTHILSFQATQMVTLYKSVLNA